MNIISLLCLAHPMPPITIPTSVRLDAQSLQPYATREPEELSASIRNGQSRFIALWFMGRMGGIWLRLPPGAVQDFARKRASGFSIGDDRYAIDQNVIHPDR